jgi:eukaryotic-like serine/threonine-protein kinase
MATACVLRLRTASTKAVIACAVASLVPRLAPGSTFADRFRIVEYVGQGSMGTVYRVESLSGGEPVALKLVGLDATTDGRALRRFEREVETGRRVRSPYVAATLESGKLGERVAWLTMEFAPGIGLDELVRTRGELPRPLATRLLRQIFRGVAAAHTEGIVHRDLKPENVRVAGADHEAHLKVLDFGIAKHQDTGTLSRTTPGLGTPLWAAPELSRDGQKLAPSADVWSLGLLSFFVLTGHLYWRHATERASVADLAMELLNAEIAPPTARVQELGLSIELPRGFDAWFGRAVNREPSARFESAARAWSELEPMLSESERDASDRPSAVVRSGVFLTAVILSCFAAGLAIYWLLRSMRI